LPADPNTLPEPAYFNPSVLGQPIHWAGGQVNYYVDQGPLNTVTNQQATAMVDAAAALWSAVPTAGVTLTDAGPLNEDVNGSNMPVSLDVRPDHRSPPTSPPPPPGYPVAVIYDADGSVIDALFGAGASQPTNCQNNGVFVWIDNINPDATIAHAIILLNGLCATNANLLEMMSFELERAFGRILNLDYSQVNPGALQNKEPGGTQGWPVMQPSAASAVPCGGACIPNPAILRYDDIAALNRIYPITAANLANFPGKQLTAANTVSIQGTITFQTGLRHAGRQRRRRPLDANGNPLYQYTVTAVSGALLQRQPRQPHHRLDDSNGNLLTMWGSNDPRQQGYFDLSGIPLPPGVTTANYQVTFEPINPFISSPTRSAPTRRPGRALGNARLPSPCRQSFRRQHANPHRHRADSAIGGYQDAIGTQAAPRPLPASGFWCGRLSQVGQSDWFTFPVRGNRTFTIVTQAWTKPARPPTKAMPFHRRLGRIRSVGATAVGAAPGLNGNATGETWLRVSSTADDIVRIGIADQRGDGRPDYAYNGWVLYADTVQPSRLPASGGPIVIQGMGFRLADTVLVGGQPAWSPASRPTRSPPSRPPAATGVTGSVDVEVDDLPAFYAAAVISGGVSYDSGTGDALTLDTAPMNTVPIGVPIPFTVTALGPISPRPAASPSSTPSPAARPRWPAACPTCSVTATGDGRATMNVTAGRRNLVHRHRLAHQRLQPPGAVCRRNAARPRLAHAAAFARRRRHLHLDVQAWCSQRRARSRPVRGLATGRTGITTSRAAAPPSPTPPASPPTLTAGPLTEGQTATINACLNGTSQCVTFTAFGARPEYATLQPSPAPCRASPPPIHPSQITLRLLDMDGNPMAGGSVASTRRSTPGRRPAPRTASARLRTLLATQAATATSALDGTVSLLPATLPGVATNLIGLTRILNSSSAEPAPIAKPIPTAICYFHNLYPRTPKSAPPRSEDNRYHA
jgi:hypothetical protein